MFLRLAHAFARGETVTEYDRGWHAGFLACLDKLLQAPATAAGEVKRKDVK